MIFDPNAWNPLLKSYDVIFFSFSFFLSVFFRHGYDAEVFKTFWPFLRLRCLMPGQGQSFETFYSGKLPPFHGNNIILCYKAILSWQLPWNGIVKSLITLAMVVNLNITLIYHRIGTLKNVSTVVNDHGIFITLALGVLLSEK